MLDGSKLYEVPPHDLVSANDRLEDLIPRHLKSAADTSPYWSCTQLLNVGLAGLRFMPQYASILCAFCTVIGLLSIPGPNTS